MSTAKCRGGSGRPAQERKRRESRDSCIPVVRGARLHPRAINMEPIYRLMRAQSSAPTRPLPSARAQILSSLTIVSSDSLVPSTCSLQRSRYLRTCSLPPPGLYSPKDDLGKRAGNLFSVR